MLPYFQQKVWKINLNIDDSKEVIKKSSTAVGLETSYSSPAGGPLPAMLTLGDLNVSLTVAGKSAITFSGGIDFRNTPDAIKYKYYYQSKASDGAFIAVRFFDQSNNEYKDGDIIITSTNSTYTEYTKPLSTNGKDIRRMNIAIGSNYDSEKFAENKIQTGADGFGVKFYVDKLEFTYSSVLAGLKANNTDASLNNKAFSVTLSDPEQVGIPQLDFMGEVSDQAQKITWQNPTKDAQ